VAAIDADISGEQAHSRSLDADTKGSLRNIHRRVGTTILFESSGGQVDKVAHLPELRFALGEPELDTTSIDNGALALEAKAFFIRKVGSDGFQIRHQPTLKKVVNDRRASLDEQTDIKPTMRGLVKKEFERGASVPIVPFPEDSGTIQDSPRLTLVVMDPEWEWTGSGDLRDQIAEWTKQRGKSPRLYPGSLVWCVRKPGRDFHEKTELALAWKRIQREITEGILGSDFDRADRAEIQALVNTAEEAAKDEVWAGYRFVVIADNQESDGLKVIDLGAGHSSSSETLCGRVIAALKSEALLNESVGAGYIDRNWPPALAESGAWPLSSLRQSFLNGALTRLLDPDKILRSKIVEFVAGGDFGLASGSNADGTYERVWYQEPLAPDEVAFESGVFLLKKARAQAFKRGASPIPEPSSKPGTVPSAPPGPLPESQPGPGPKPAPVPESRTLRIVGTVPPELWNRLGTRVLPKLRSGSDLKVGVDFTVTVSSDIARSIASELRQILEDLDLGGKVRIEQS
jgi:hypothetical protein